MKPPVSVFHINGNVHQCQMRLKPISSNPIIYTTYTEGAKLTPSEENTPTPQHYKDVRTHDLGLQVSKAQVDRAPYKHRCQNPRGISQ